MADGLLERLAVNTIDYDSKRGELPSRYILYDGEESTLEESMRYFVEVLKDRNLDIPVVIGKNDSEDYGCLINVREYLINCIWE